MSLTNRSGAMTPRVLMAVALLAAAAARAGASPQEGSAERRATVRARSCSDCVSTDSLRRAREALLLRVDSLRWEVENRRLSDGERQAVAEEMSRTLRALERSMAEAMRQRTVVVAAESEALAARRVTEAGAVAYIESKPRVKGYLGVTFDGPWAESGRSNERVIRFYQYPRIALVEAASPAERAGVLVGDTLLALNGTDVRENEISFTRLLVPNKRITMRVRRDGSPHDVRVTVGDTPEYYVRRLAPAPGTAVATIASAPDAPRVRAIGGTRPPPTPAAPTQGYMYWFGNDALAGARLETITGGLAKALDVSEGVLVIRTAPGSLAYESGLREGDVVTHVGTAKVRTVGELQQRIARADRSDATLVIVRDKKRREITLRW